MMSTWNDAVRLSELKIQIADGTEQGNIYGNGLHQVAVIIRLVGANSASDPVSLSQKDIPDLLNTVKLVDSLTGEALTHQNSDGWYYTDQQNEFSRPIPLHAHSPLNAVADSDATIIKYYIQCGKTVTARNRKIAVSVTLANGNQISTADGSASGYHSAVLLAALDPVVHKMDSIEMLPTIQEIPVTDIKDNTVVRKVAQVNCFVKLKDKDIVKYSILGNSNDIIFDRDARYNGTNLGAQFRELACFRPSEKRLASIFTYRALSGDPIGYINQHQGAVTFAVWEVVFSDGLFHSPTEQHHQQPIEWVIYDWYGNTGTFYIEFNPYGETGNDVRIKDSSPGAVAKSIWNIQYP